MDGLSPYPNDLHISAEKLSRNSRNAVNKEYDKIKRISPGQNAFINALLSWPVIGWRFVRSVSSSSVGGGSLLISHKKTNKGRKKRQADTKGIQNSVTPQSRITKPPTVFPKPAEKIKLTDKLAPSTSVLFLPSK